MSDFKFDRPNDLTQFFLNSPHRRIMKWSSYFEVYEELFGPYRSRPITFLEIGVAGGGSLQMWKEYFQQATIVGIDINAKCKRFEESRVHIRIGDQADASFLQSVAEEFSPFDIVLDDGGHKMHQQIVSFEMLYPHVRDEGMYLVEDTHTSYWPEEGGGYRQEHTFIEYAKRKLDEVNGGFFCQEPSLLTAFARNCYRIAFYDSMVAITKRGRKVPQHLIIPPLEES